MLTGFLERQIALLDRLGKLLAIFQMRFPNSNTMYT